MLRWAVVLLLLANAGYFAWTQGHLGSLGLTPIDQREPERLTQQIKPETLRLLNGPKGAPEAPAAPRPSVPAPAPAPAPPPPEAISDAAPPAAALPSAAAAVAPTPTPVAAANAARSCWQVAGFTEAQAELLRAELALLGLKADQWQFNEVRSSGRWIVYMGRYDNADQVDRKKAELRALGVQFRELSAAGLAPGLALGTYSTEAAAQQALRQTEQSGVRTAKVAQERAESVALSLRLPAITESQRAAIDGLREAMAGKALRSCG